MNGPSVGAESEGVVEGRSKGDGKDEKGRKMSLLDLLMEAELSSYHAVMKTKLKLKHAEHLKFVTEDDLVEIGMSKPEQRRLLKTFHRYFPVSLVGKIRKKLCKQLGEGEFGAVWQGVWQSSNDRVQVAVKCVASDKLLSNPLSFLQEAAIMHRINHAHIVRLFGVVLDTKEIMLVTELAPLRSLLECLKERALKASFPLDRLCEYVEQICQGMCYLESQRLIHRDLAARNILVFSAEKVKISDFGLSRSLGVGEDYYRSNFSVSLKLPIAWCAPEAINFLKFTSASDVWAFGVTMWEMFSYGFQPWVGMTGAQILSAIDSPRSQRLEQPDACPQEYYSLMLQCWEHDPNNRPKFADIRTVLPEIQPQRVRAIAACADGQLDHLQYAKDELITVLSKRPREYPDGYYWRGVLKSGRTGLFLPSNTIAHIGAEYPSSMLSTSVDGSGNNMTSSISALKSSFGRADKKKKAPPQRPIISEPQGDLRHTYHLGIDGDSFEISDKKHLPRHFVSPVPQRQASPSSSMTESISLSMSSASSSLLPRKARAPSPQRIDLDIPTFENSTFSDITGQSSLLDEVFEALHVASDSDTTLVCDNSGFTTSIADYSDTAQLIANGHRSFYAPSAATTPTSAALKPRPEAHVRPMSQVEAKKWSVLSEKAHRKADKKLDEAHEKERATMIALGIIEPPPPIRSNSVKDRVVGSLRSITRSRSRDSSSECSGETVIPKSFSDSLPSKNDTLEQGWTPEAQDAYKLLVQCGRRLQADESSEPSKQSGSVGSQRNAASLSPTYQPATVVSGRNAASLSPTNQSVTASSEPAKQSATVGSQRNAALLSSVNELTAIDSERKAASSSPPPVDAPSPPSSSDPPPPSTTASDEDANPLRRLRSDGGMIARSFRPAPKGKQSSTGKIGPPVPPKPMTKSFSAADRKVVEQQEQVTTPIKDNGAPGFTSLESVDKYQLLDFVMQAFDTPPAETDNSPITTTLSTSIFNSIETPLQRPGQLGYSKLTNYHSEMTPDFARSVACGSLIGSGTAQDDVVNL